MDTTSRPPYSVLLVLGLALLLVALLGVGFWFWQGQDDDRLTLPTGPKEETLRFPMPEPPPGQTPADLARGIYTLTAGERRYSLELRTGSRFKFVSSKGGRVITEGRGTWTVARDDPSMPHKLTLVYTDVTGRPGITPEKPEVATNRWTGRTIELGDTGLDQPVILRKQTAVRAR